MDAAKITVVAAVVSGSIVVICIIIIVLVVLLCRCSRRKSRRRRHDWLRQQYHAEVSDVHRHISASVLLCDPPSLPEAALQIVLVRLSVCFRTL